MDDRPRRPGGPQGQPGRPVPPRAPGRQNRPGNPGTAPPPGRNGRAPGGVATRSPGTDGPAPPELPPEGDTWSRSRRSSTRVAPAGRVLVALLSVVVLITTGYFYATLRTLTAGLNTNDVIDSGESHPDGATDILLVGNDNRTDAQGNPLPEKVLETLRTTFEGEGQLTDTMILVRIPNGGGRASAVSFPRDTMVDLGKAYGGRQKLNSAWGRAKNVAAAQLQKQGLKDPKEIEKQSTAAGQKFLVETIGRLSGISVDHYAEVNLLGFFVITQAVGGVDVCLKAPVNDKDYSGAVFPAGRQTIQGGDALAFVRQRHELKRGDLDRVVRQQVFMSGLAQKMLGSGTLSNPSKMSALVEAVKKSVVLDKGWDVINFAQEMQNISGGNIDFQTIPVKLVGQSGEEEVTADPLEVKQFVENLLLDPNARRAKEQQQHTMKAGRSQVTVNVFNASGITGLANRVADTLSSAGFKQGTSSNSQSMPKSVVYFPAGQEAAAQQVSQALGGIPVQPSKDRSPAIAVYLGSDYKGPGAQMFAGPKPMKLDGMQRTGPLPAQAPEPDDDQPITADGIPCVN